MGQLGFFDADKRLVALSAKGDPLGSSRGNRRMSLVRAVVTATCSSAGGAMAKVALS